MMLRPSNERSQLDLLLLLAVLVALSALKRDSPGIDTIEVSLTILVPLITAWAVLRGGISNDFRFEDFALPRWVLFLTVFTMWAIVNLAVATTNGVTLLNWGRRVFPVLTLPLIGVLSAITFRGKRGVHIGYVLLVATGMFMTISSLIGLFGVDLSSVQSLQAIRQFGGGYYAAIGLSLVAPTLFKISYFNRYQQVVLFLTAAIFAFGLVVSFTRTYWVSTSIAIGVGGAFALQTDSREILYTARWLLPVGAVMALIILLTSPDQFYGFILERVGSFSNAFNSGSVQDRVMELRGIVRSSRGEPLGLLIGHGFGSEFTFYSVNPFSWSGVGLIRNEYSHNYYAYLYWTTGFIGLCIYLLFWTWYCRDLIGSILNRSPSDAVYLLAILTAMINMLIASLTAPPLMNLPWPVFYGILLGIGHSAIQTVEG